MKSLGSKISPYGSPEPYDFKKEKEKVHYPNTTLHNDQIDTLGDKIPKVGSTGHARIKYKITSHEDRGKQGGRHLGMDITHIEPQEDDNISEKDFED